MPKLVLIRGLPGSGKSTMAAAMEGYTHLENDMFLMENGEYKWTHKKWKQAMRHCIAATRRALLRGEDVVVSNCFLSKFSMVPYHDAAREAGAEVEERIVRGDYESVHHVPASMLESMRKRWED